MIQDRLKQLQQFYEEDPTDPFNLYGLALEYRKIDPKKSEEFFDMLLSNFPEYLPTYYIAAKLKEEKGSKEEAIDLYKKGMILAKKLNNASAYRELQSAMDELGFE